MADTKTTRMAQLEAKVKELFAAERQRRIEAGEPLEDVGLYAGLEALKWVEEAPDE